MAQEQKPRERSFIREIVPDWRPTREQKLWTTRIAIMLVAVLGVLTLIGLPFDITLWNWMDLLIIPVVLAIGGYLFTRTENRATQAVAERRAQDEALQAYLDQMSAMLLPDKDQPSLYRAHPGDSLSYVARARTLTVLPRLDEDRKARVVQFLHESGLITIKRTIVAMRGADLSGTNLSRANLYRAHLSRVVLSGAVLYEANLLEADRSEADLSGADLSKAVLHGAVLSRADLSKALLSGAVLSKVAVVPVGSNDVEEVPGADLVQADLSGADLSGADLSGALLAGTDLSGANLSGTNLSGAYLSALEVQLAQAASVEGATMPNGQKYEDWIKDKEGHR